MDHAVSANSVKAPELQSPRYAVAPTSLRSCSDEVVREVVETVCATMVAAVDTFTTATEHCRARQYFQLSVASACSRPDWRRPSLPANDRRAAAQ
jgi:hypothetical protein